MHFATDIYWSYCWVILMNRGVADITFLLFFFMFTSRATKLKFSFQILFKPTQNDSFLKFHSECVDCVESKKITLSFRCLKFVLILGWAVHIFQSFTSVECFNRPTSQNWLKCVETIFVEKPWSLLSELYVGSAYYTRILHQIRYICYHEKARNATLLSQFCGV